MKVAIIHPWFPQYRRSFFEGLINRCQSEDILIDIYYGETPPEWGQRGDSVTSIYAHKLPTKFYKWGGRTFVYKSLKKVRHNGPYDLIIVEQAVRNLETYELFLKRISPRIAFWGHGRTYTKSIGRIQEYVKNVLTLRGHWFFAYTRGGLEHMQNNGFDASSMTLVQNSIDVRGLSESLHSVSDASLAAFRKKWEVKGQTGVFIGGLDQSKRLDFMISACERVAGELSDFRLLIIGDGELKDIVIEAQDRVPWLKYLGPLFDDEKALALKSSDVIIMPGRVGLVAVDSFAAKLPIVTTDWALHAPEFEYLTDGFNSLVTDNNLDSYARTLVDVLADKDTLNILQNGCAESALEFSSDKMINNFFVGIKKALGI